MCSFTSTYLLSFAIYTQLLFIDEHFSAEQCSLADTIAVALSGGSTVGGVKRGDANTQPDYGQRPRRLEEVAGLSRTKGPTEQSLVSILFLMVYLEPLN